MAKSKTNYICTACGGSSIKWAGRCPDCTEWNTLVESVVAPEGPSSRRYAGWTGATAGVVDLASVKNVEFSRVDTGMPELNRVLGGGIVGGSVILLGGDPGVGKSTLLLQVMATLGDSRTVLYATGEESAAQVAMRAARLGRGDADIKLLAEVELEKVQEAVHTHNPEFLVIDSIQTLYSSQLQSAPGTVAQVRECTAHLTRMAKSLGVSIFLVGHVTKEGSLAGPRVLEHMVDCVLYFEGEQGSPFRMIRALKNRFGSANELGVFSMGEAGLAEVSNPSSMFLTTHERPVSGSCILAAMEGNRPFLVEVQALVEDTPSPNAKRSASGVDTNRLQMLLAVLNKHAGVLAFDKNVYAKVVGGVRLTEPAADLAVLLATHSSLINKPLPANTVVFGEVGLAGEVRAVQDAETRLKEAVKLGFTSAIIPAQCHFHKPVPGISVIKVARVDQALNAIRDLKKAA
jgi:DNA repair protein RadA/Sms